MEVRSPECADDQYGFFTGAGLRDAQTLDPHAAGSSTKFPFPPEIHPPKDAKPVPPSPKASRLGTLTQTLDTLKGAICYHLYEGGLH